MTKRHRSDEDTEREEDARDEVQGTSAGDADFYQASVTESRLRELRQEVVDQKKRISQGGPG